MACAYFAAHVYACLHVRIGPWCVHACMMGVPCAALLYMPHSDAACTAVLRQAHWSGCKPCPLMMVSLQHVGSLRQQALPTERGSPWRGPCGRWRDMQPTTAPALNSAAAATSRNHRSKSLLGNAYAGRASYCRHRALPGARRHHRSTLHVAK